MEASSCDTNDLPTNGLLQGPVGDILGQLQAPVAPMTTQDGVSSGGSVVSAALAPLSFPVRRKLSKVPLVMLFNPSDL